VFTTQLCPDVYVARDWNWEKPREPQAAEQQSEASAGLEWFEYPGGFLDAQEGGRHAKDRLCEASLPKYVLEGRSNCARLEAGRTFEIADTKPEYLARDYLILALERHFEQQAYGSNPGYRAAFRAVPGNTVFRPPRVTPKPR